MIAILLVLAVIAAIVAAVYARVLFRRYSEERTEKGRVLSLFSRYVPAPVVQELLARRDPRLFQAREYYATIVCCRIHNFALLSESLSPEETLRYLNEFYTIVGRAVQSHRGMIESLRGDTVIAVFGVLLEETLQEDRALRASLDIMRLVKAMENRWQAQSRKSFTVGIGVNSGRIVAGDTGFQQRREFAIIGNPADVAARLEAASEELNATIVASQSTFSVVQDSFVGVPTSTLPLRGLKRLQNAYIIRGVTRRAQEKDTLTMPTQSQFAKTIVESEPPPAPSPVPDPAMFRDAGRVDQAKTAPTIVDQRVGGPLAFPQSTRYEPAERIEPRFSSFDDEDPIMPDLPIAGTYEDDHGPPIQLPP
jgi:class 3 adenylate cyclase